MGASKVVPEQRAVGHVLLECSYLREGPFPFKGSNIFLDLFKIVVETMGVLAFKCLEIALAEIRAMGGRELCHGSGPTTGEHQQDKKHQGRRMPGTIRTGV